jgi:uncharacterized protein
VSYSSSSLRINVGFLVNQPVGFSRDVHFDPENIYLSPDLDLRDFFGVLRLGRTPHGVLARGDFKASMEFECGRCLNAFWMQLNTSFNESYHFKKQLITEAELIIPSDQKIDFSPLLRECLLLEIPINPICKPECKGLCIVCGADLNEIDCEHQYASAD